MSKTTTQKTPAANKAPRVSRKANGGITLAKQEGTQEQAPKQEETKAPEVVASKGITHAIKDGFRPLAGAALYAHTAVFLKHSGIDKAPVPSATVRTIIGGTALAYHVKAGNFAYVGDTPTQRGGVIVTPQGQGNFSKRQTNAELVSAFEAVLTQGVCDDRVIKNPVGIIQIAAAK
jgi:hypothetical protein